MPCHAMPCHTTPRQVTPRCPCRALGQAAPGRCRTVSPLALPSERPSGKRPGTARRACARPCDARCATQRRVTSVQGAATQRDAPRGTTTLGPAESSWSQTSYWQAAAIAKLCQTLIVWFDLGGRPERPLLPGAYPRRRNKARRRRPANLDPQARRVL
jgi:hypothetical protein